jgi:hypothetical protein
MDGSGRISACIGFVDHRLEVGLDLPLHERTDRSQWDSSSRRNRMSSVVCVELDSCRFHARVLRPWLAALDSGKRKCGAGITGIGSAAIPSVSRNGASP